ncbi:shikimate dehydrogenase [Candidatus Daviesbacteria bacterium]|nr:shikimate dehydrogenase [Candidatus Daviesbacteria bacterium]
MKICLSIGYPIKTSQSPSMHNAGYKKLGIDYEFIYLSAEVKPKDLKKAIDGVKALGIRGVSVTMPHKQKVLKYLDKIDEEAKEIGAVNTIVNDNGTLTGFNTDSIGAIVALEKKTNLKRKSVALIGAGGAARAIVYGLRKKSSIVKIFNRSLDHAKELAKGFGCEYAALNSLEQALDMDIIINATSVGMNEDRSPINKKFLNKNQIILDIVNSPKETKLIKDAKEKGAEIIYGYEMLLYQGIEQFKLYTGFNAPVDAMREVLVKNLK